MHPYATDSNERRIVPLYLSAISILAAWGFNRLLKYYDIQFPWWIDAPSLIGFYGLLYLYFERHIWKWSIFRWIGIVNIPALNGQWNGYVTSSFDEHAHKIKGQLVIKQSWTYISIKLETETSWSMSVTASISVRDPVSKVMTYEYQNEPKPGTVKTMHIHKGMTRLSIKENGNTLEGEYYTGRDRQSFGMIIFKKK
jgi:hypothetical protein